MSQAKWIWNDGDFETYHYMLLSCRRQEFECDYPCLWPLSRPSVSASFKKHVEIPKDTVIHAVTHSSKGLLLFNDIKCPVNRDVPIAAGSYEVVAVLYDLTAFPTFFLDHEYLKTDESWLADARDGRYRPAGCRAEYASAGDDPAVFPFVYETVEPVEKSERNGGILYDFGREWFGPVSVAKAEEGEEILLCYGESEQEALDTEHALLRETLAGDFPCLRPSRAFRWIFVKSNRGRAVSITASYEFLPIEDKARFSCDDPQIETIWQLCSHTFHLNSREFYLDGIKRDRWVWSGDAYQSFMVNRYLYFEPDIIRRTITALLGKPPYHLHVNTINDYSAFLILSVWEYYFATGDKAFVARIWEKIKALYDFIVSRLENGYVVRRENDWIFIDWGDVDKEGTLCAEQILLWRVYQVMANLSVLMGENDLYSEKAEALRRAVYRDFWDDGRSAFIDCPDTGRRHLSRQSNILAILYDFTDEATARRIEQAVLKNEEITPISTPYFKLYELMALCKLGNIEEMQRYITGYWGGMVRLGATSVWEQYDPADQGDAHFAMYGMKYGKSLCHAWGSGPIYLLGRYCCGVYPTDVGYQTFTVAPAPGLYQSFSAAVPIRNGVVELEYAAGRLTVKTNAEGGTLCFGGKTLALPKGEAVTVTKDGNAGGAIS